MDLPGPRAKFERAVENFRALEAEGQAFLEGKPFYFDSEFDEDDKAHHIRFRVRPGMSPRLSAIFGDLIHNLRSSLDHAVWLLACRSTSVESVWQKGNAESIHFPVMTSNIKFLKLPLHRFIASDASALLARFQPFPGAGETARRLARLHRFWNIDKHRMVHLCVARVEDMGLAFRPSFLLDSSFPSTTEPITEWQGPDLELEDRTVIAKVRFADGAGPPFTGLRLDGTPQVTLNFGSGGEALHRSAINSLFTAANEVLEAIEALPSTPD